MARTISRIVLITVIITTFTEAGKGQAAMPEILNQGTITEQMEYIQGRTLIYENYRAIREDMFQKIKNNSIDSLNKSKREILDLESHAADLNQRIDSLDSSLYETMAELNQVKRTKDSISVLGIELNKTVYNTIMWLIVGGLLVILLLGYLIFRNSLRVTRITKKDLLELKEEYDEYRNKTRLERERVSMEHFREVQKLKGKQY